MPGERTVVRLSPSLVAVDDSVILMLMMMHYSMKLLFTYQLADCLPRASSMMSLCSWLLVHGPGPEQP